MPPRIDARRAGRRLGPVLAFAVLLFGGAGAGCGPSSLAILPGVLNDPHNLSLRRSILEYGTSRICGEMQRRSLPLKVRDPDPVIGRFFPGSCSARSLDDRGVLIQFAGAGYAWTNVTKRIGFRAEGTVEYEHDFLMDGGTMYVYFRARRTSDAKLEAGLVEQPGVASVLGMPIAPGGPSFASAFGTSVMRSQIARGVTVVRQADGSVEIGIGVVERGRRPVAPFRVIGTGRALLANERVEVHQNQREFVGPLEIDDSGSALHVALAVEGAPGIDVLVVSRAVGEPWLNQYLHQAEPTPPTGSPSFDEPVFAGATWRRTIALPRGQYYVVLDNTSTAGRTAPTAFGGDDRAAMVRYAIELGDAP